MYFQGSDELRVHFPLFAVICTMKNEQDRIGELIEALTSQTLIPNEIIFVDGGSSDGTLRVVQDLAERLSLPIRVLEVPNANIAAGRNIAIQQVQHEFVLCVDAGSRPDRNYCRALMGTFADSPDVDLVSGIYHAAVKGSPGTRFVPDWNTVDYFVFLAVREMRRF